MDIKSYYQAIEIKPNNDWKISLNKLHNIPPDIADEITGLQEGFTIWDLYFVQDLFQATNAEQSQLLDVGWYPDGAPDGCFRLLLVQKKSDSNDYDWWNPVEIFETRETSELVSKIQKLFSSSR